MAGEDRAARGGAARGGRGGWMLHGAQPCPVCAQGATRPDRKQPGEAALGAAFIFLCATASKARLGQ